MFHLASLPGGLTRARLAVLPLGTVNVFAKELRIPTGFAEAWQVIEAGHERVIDLPYADSLVAGDPERRYFAQMAGAGIDSRALSLVNWELKKKAGVLAYVWASLQALRGPRPQVTVEATGRSVIGQLVLIGNGRFYGGRYPVFPEARLDDGRLDVTVFPRVNWLTITRVYLSLQGNRLARSPDAICFQAESVTLSARDGTPWHVEGDNVGALPRRFFIRPRALRVVVPG